MVKLRAQSGDGGQLHEGQELNDMTLCIETIDSTIYVLTKNLLFTIVAAVT